MRTSAPPVRVKEWAYAGIFFTLNGAAVSHAASGDPIDERHSSAD
jgi:hypothetical protein